MRKHLLSAIVFVAACTPIVGLGAASSTAPGDSGRDASPAEAQVPGSFAPARRDDPEQTQDRSTNDKGEKPRGNTPPGMDRTGAGPAHGAIVDPAGVVTKEP